MSEHLRGASLVDWRLALENINDPLSDRLQEVTDPYAHLRELGLPSPPYIGFESISEFLEESDRHLLCLEQQGIESFYVGLRPVAAGLAKYRELGLSHDQVVSYIVSKVAPENYSDYLLRVAEYAPAIYGGVMIINPSGLVRLEMVNGEMGDLATDRATPDYVDKPTHLRML